MPAGTASLRRRTLRKGGKQEEIRRLAGLLYSQRLDVEALKKACPWICRIMNAHYFAFCRFSFLEPGGSIVFSNNPSEFVEAYASLQEKDIIMKNLVNQRRTISLRSLHDWDAPSNQDFLSPLQKLRPSCDGIYVPAIFKGDLIGFWAVARAGLHTSVFSMNDLRIFEFLSSFLSDTVYRSLTALPAPDDTAHLNSRVSGLFSVPLSIRLFWCFRFHCKTALGKYL